MSTENEKSQKGFLSRVWKAHMTVAKYVGLFGIPAVFGFLPKAAFNAVAANPAAGIADTFTTLWGMMGGAIGEFMIPGWSVIFGQLGDGVGAAFNAVAAIAAPALPLPTPAP